jgi:hypothetical protein
MKASMKIRSILAGLAVVTSLMVTAENANASPVPSVLICVDENGNGSITFVGSPDVTTLPGVLAPDPGPGGLASALTYDLLGPPSLVAGDLQIFDADGTLSDIIRFNPAGTGNPDYPASLVFYSDPGDSDLADTGFPARLYDNLVTVTETGPEDGPNGYMYTPTENQPGFVAGFAVTYKIISAVPEPGSLALCGIGMATVGVITVRRRRKEAEAV